jgi:hypothetical protein
MQRRRRNATNSRHKYYTSRRDSVRKVGRVMAINSLIDGVDVRWNGQGPSGRFIMPLVVLDIRTIGVLSTDICSPVYVVFYVINLCKRYSEMKDYTNA